MTAPKAYALFFSFQDTVEGSGFLARVTARGRALMVHEEDEAWWLYGVEPGAIADTGASPPEAYLAFRQAFTKVLFDFAAEARSFEDFERQVKEFFAAVDVEDETRWRDAVEALRAGRLEPEKPFDELPRWDAEDGCAVVVERLDIHHREFNPDANRVDSYGLSNCA